MDGRTILTASLQVNLTFMEILFQLSTLFRLLFLVFVVFLEKKTNKKTAKHPPGFLSFFVGPNTALLSGGCECNGQHLQVGSICARTGSTAKASAPSRIRSGNGRVFWRGRPLFPSPPTKGRHRLSPRDLEPRLRVPQLKVNISSRGRKKKKNPSEVHPPDSSNIPRPPS